MTKIISGKYPFDPTATHEEPDLSGITMLTFPGAAGDGSGLHPDSDLHPEGDQLLGNDFVFFTAFVTSFLFNWIGFLLLMCFCHTIAARYERLKI